MHIKHNQTLCGAPEDIHPLFMHFFCSKGDKCANVVRMTLVPLMPPRGLTKTFFLNLKDTKCYRGDALTLSRYWITYRSLPSDDPFGERSSWEDPKDGAFAGWKDIQDDHFVEAADSQEVRQAHFGPEWARFSTVGRMAVEEARRRASSSTPTTSPSTSHDAVHSRRVSARREMLAKNNYSSYEEYLESNAGGDEDPQQHLADASSQTTLVEDESVMDAPRLPSFLKAEAESGVRPNTAPTLIPLVSPSLSSEDCARVYAQLPSEVSSAEVSTDDPLLWSTEDIIAFLIHFSPKTPEGDPVMDDALIDAFRMSSPTGATLLNTVSPPRLFRIMRRWHLTRQRVALKALSDSSPNAITHAVQDGIPALKKVLLDLTPELIQETILLCFPYGYGRS